MQNGTGPKYSIDLSFEEIKLPPFQDILILGKNSQHGKIGILRSFEMLAPNGFEVLEVVHDNVEAVFVNKRILNKINKETMLDILVDKVFPYASEGELLKVDFKLVISYTNLEHEI